MASRLDYPKQWVVEPRAPAPVSSRNHAPKDPAAGSAHSLLGAALRLTAARVAAWCP
jgi:hypothetical protein